MNIPAWDIPAIFRKKRTGRTRNNISPKKPRRFSVSLTKRAVLIPVLIIAALIFAQSLKLPVSYMVFIFTLLFPIMPAIHLIFAALFIRTSVRVQVDTAEKNTPFDFVSLISNNSLIPFSFVEAELLLPDKMGAKCVPHNTIFTLAPFDGVEIRKSAEFAFRGEYKIGLSKIIVSDPFRMAKISIVCEHTASVTVLPRRFELPPKEAAAESDQTIRTAMRAKGSDVTEAADIRAYLAGDSLKSIHWKLSSKTEDILVKDYSHNIGDTVHIICDLEPHFADGSSCFEPIEGYEEVYDNLCSDLAVENSLAAALRELRAGNSVKLLWLSEHGGQLAPCSFDIYNTNDFEEAFRSIARAPIVNTNNQASRLVSLITDMNGASLVIVSSNLGAAAVDEYLQIASLREELGAKGVELIYVTAPAFRKPDSEAEAAESKQLAALSGYMTITRRISEK